MARGRVVHYFLLFIKNEQWFFWFLCYIGSSGFFVVFLASVGWVFVADWVTNKDVLKLIGMVKLDVLLRMN